MDSSVLLFVILFGLGAYFFACFVQFKVCEKFGVGSLFECCIPIYNVVLLCKCAEISGWNVLWFIIPNIIFTGELALIASIVNIVFTVVLWGRIAERMGRGFWQYGLGSAFLLGIPILVLAFGSAHPSDAGVLSNDFEIQHSDEPIYKPLASPEAFGSVSETVPLRAQSSSLAKLYCRHGDFKGHQIEVPHDGITIGRDPSFCQIVISSNEASRTHTKIKPIENSRGVVLNDLNSTNGTFYLVNDGGGEGQWKRVDGPISLGPGKRFRVGKSLAEFEVV